MRKGSISQEQKTGNVLFKYFDDSGRIIGAEKVGTSTEHKFKGIAQGSDSSHGFEVLRGTGENAYFFESAIDLLSHLQMHRNLDNCRLVSMMGVKPNIVLDTMKRHNIAPENIYICSDNDTAGNDFADRLRAQYPDIKRISTPDRYKDWNDMLRGAEREVKNLAERQFYGNKAWNDATDNRDKSLVTVSINDFDRLRTQLENAGMNYYGYARGDSVVMAVNDGDVDTLRKVANATTLEPRKSDRPYSPPQNNIIGNTEYRYIPQKEYITAERDLILKMAERMEQQGLRFSGRIYPSGKGTLTVSHNDLQAVRAIQQNIVEQRKSIGTAKKGQNIGSYQRNADTRYFMSKIPAENWAEVEKILDTTCDFHIATVNSILNELIFGSFFNCFSYLRFRCVCHFTTAHSDTAFYLRSFVKPAQSPTSGILCSRVSFKLFRKHKFQVYLMLGIVLNKDIIFGTSAEKIFPTITFRNYFVNGIFQFGFP